MRKLIYHKFPTAKPWYRFVAVFMLMALCFWLNITCLSFSLCEIRGNSMQNTLLHGQVIVVKSRGYTLAHGDIVVFDAGENDHIKRIIGMGGDKIRATCNQGEIALYFVDGESGALTPIVEPYIKDGAFRQKTVKVSEDLSEVNKALVTGLSNLYDGKSFEFTVPNGYLFVLGDNREVSLDSRNHGFVSEQKVQSKVVESRNKTVTVTVLGRKVTYNPYVTGFKILRLVGLLTGYLGYAAIFIAGSPILFDGGKEGYGKN